MEGGLRLAQGSGVLTWDHDARFHGRLPPVRRRSGPPGPSLDPPPLVPHDANCIPKRQLPVLRRLTMPVNPLLSINARLRPRVLHPMSWRHLLGRVVVVSCLAANALAQDRPPCCDVLQHAGWTSDADGLPAVVLDTRGDPINYPYP